MQQQTSGIADIVEDSRPVGGNDFTETLGQCCACLRPECRAPQRRPVLDQHSHDRLLLHLGNLRQHIAAPGHLLSNAALQVEDSRALRLQGYLCRRNGG